MDEKGVAEPQVTLQVLSEGIIQEAEEKDELGVLND